MEQTNTTTTTNYTIPSSTAQNTTNYCSYKLPCGMCQITSTKCLKLGWYEPNIIYCGPTPTTVTLNKTSSNNDCI